MKNGCFATSLATHYIYTPQVPMDKLQDAKLQLIVYIMHLIVTQLQFNKKIHFQLLFNSIINIPMKSLIVIHILKSNMWHYEKNWTFFFCKY
jgi:hypothetical protein